MSAGAGSDQRKSGRYRYRLPIDLHGPGGSERTFTEDVARQGVFLLTRAALRPRHLVKLTLHLPSGPIGAVAHVTRATSSGAGLQLFALSGDAKRRWDAFLFQVAGVAPAQPGWIGRAASFVVKLRSTEALDDFLQKCVAVGATFLRTPVLKPVGAEVVLVMVHPRSCEEFPLPGVVARLVTAHPKGMEIHFAPGSRAVGSALAERFRAFVRTGRPPAEDLFDEDEFEEITLSDLRSDRTLELDIDVVDVPLPGGALPDEDDWFDFTQVERAPAPLVRPPRELLATPAAAPPRSNEAPSVDAARPRLRVEVRCDRCDMTPAVLEVGPAPGALGLVADERPCFCARCGALQVGRRLALAEERRRLLGALEERGGRALEERVPAALLFEVAELSLPPRCPSCRGRLVLNEAVRALDRELQRLLGDDDAVPGEGRAAEVPCALCARGRWRVRRLRAAGDPAKSVVSRRKAR